jgi:hypothetical protein
LPANIESIRAIDNTMYMGIKASDVTNNSSVDFNMDSSGFNRRPRRIRTETWYPFYHAIFKVDLIRYQIFSLEQLNSNEL